MTSVVLQGQRTSLRIDVFKHVFIVEKIALVLSCPSVRLLACISTAPTGWISVKLDVRTFMKICRATPDFVKTRQKYWVLYGNT
jgi:hypothetical protein